jgi:hypothetical protein
MSQSGLGVEWKWPETAEGKRKHMGEGYGVEKENVMRRKSQYSDMN